MCGIAGLVLAPGAEPDREVLGRMAAALAHRGPDEETARVFGRAGFAFRRLSIIDVAGGAQPLANEDGTIQLVLNGEIYNHAELRRSSKAAATASGRGPTPRWLSTPTRSRATRSSSGWKACSRSRFGTRRGAPAAGRDRLGKKPLVYFEGARGSPSRPSSARSSRPRRAAGGRSDAIDLYLTWQYVPAPRTAFAGVRKLRPGHCLVSRTAA